MLLALLAYVGFMAAWAMGKAASRPCAGINVTIENNSPIAAGMSQESVKSELGFLARNFASTPVGRINTDSLETKLNRVNNFEHVECYFNTKGELCLDVTPMVPVARIFTSNDSYYINREGKRIDARPEYFVNVPVVSGNFSSKLPPKNVLPVIEHISSDAQLNSLVSMVLYKSPTNIYLVPRIRGHIINLGDTTLLEDKFANLKLFYRKVMPVKGWNFYDTITLKYKGQIVATRRDKTIQGNREVLVDYDDSEDVEIPLEDVQPPSVTMKNQKKSG